jgi:hypothetical protein
MVITSRIHCALPCLGLGTPMIFVINEIMRSSDNIFNAPNRFGGLINLFRVMEYNYSGLSTSDEVLSKIDHVHSSTSFDNKKDWIPYKDALIKMCTIFFA